MRIITSTQWILALLLFFTSNFVTQAQTLDATFSSPLTTQCSGDLFTLNATNSSYQSYSWTITGPNAFTSNLSGSSTSINLTEAGTYNVSLIVSDGISTETSIVNDFLTVDAPPTIALTVSETSGTVNDGSVCPNATAAISATVSAPGGNFLWSNGATTSAISVIPPITTTYTLTYTLGCATNSSTQITVLGFPTPSFTPLVSNFCSPPATVTFTNTSTNALGGVTWNFQGGSPTTSTANNPSVTYNSSGSYSITMSATSAAGCTRTTVFPNVITVDSGTPPTSLFNATTPLTQCYSSIAAPANAVADNSVCFEYLGTGADTLQLNWGDGSNLELIDEVSAFCHTFLTSGTFTVTATPYSNVDTQLGCAGTPVSFTVVIQGPVASFSVSAIDCENQLTRTFTNTSIGVSGSATFAWDFGDPASSINNSSTLQTISHTFTQYQSSGYPVNLTVTDASSGCPASSITTNIFAYPNNTATFQSYNNTSSSRVVTTEVCLNGSLAFYNETPLPQLATQAAHTVWNINNTNASWTTANAVRGNPNTYSFLETGNSTNFNVDWVPGIYTVSMRNRRDNPDPNNSCFEIETRTNYIKIHGIIGTFTAAETVCTNASLSVTDTSSAPVTSIVSRLWNWGDGTANTTGNVSNPSHTYTNAGTYTISLTATDVFGCTKTTTKQVVVQSPTVNPIPDQTVCAGQSTTPIIFSGSNPNNIYNWSHSNQAIGLTFSAGSGNIPSFQAQDNSSFPLISTFTVMPSLNGCLGTAINFTITVNPSATVNPIPDQIVCAGDSITTIAFSGSAQQYNWTNDNVGIGLGASGTGNIAGFVATNPAATNQISTITVTPISGSCSSTPTTFTITVKPIPTVYIPPNQTLCHNDSTLTINFSGAINGTDYNWTNSNSSIGYVNSGTGNIPSFQVQNPYSGSQIANFIVTPFLDGCSGISDTFSISVNPLPLINAGNDTILCFGESFTPTANGNSSIITWSNGIFDGTPFTPTVTETYIATGVDLNSCSNSDSITVTVNSVPQLTISTFDGEDSLACDGTLSVLVTDGTAPYSYTWTNGASNYTTSAIQDLCSGTYSLAVVDANGCSASNSAIINDTLIENGLGDTLIFTDNIYQDSTIIGADTSAWIENCTFDYSLVTGATIDSYVDSGDSTIVTWLVALSNGSTVSVDATYYMSPGTTGVYDLTLQLYCSAKSGPKFLVASSRLYYEPSTIGIQSLALNGVFLYPNPTSSTLSILGVNSNFTYNISDLQGKKLKQGANDKQIEIENLPAGTYLIGISTDNGVKQLRFVKL